MALLYPPARRGLYSGIRGVCGDTSATSAGSVFKYPPYISVEWSLLSKGLRGGMSRSDRVVSLLRHMLQVKTQKTHEERITPSVRAVARPAPPTRLALRSCRQGERYISKDISRCKREFRVYRMDVSRFRPCVRLKLSRISVE